MGKRNVVLAVLILAVLAVAGCSGCTPAPKPKCGRMCGAESWRPALPPAKLPIAVMGNAVAALGRQIYCFGGLEDREFSAKAFVYEPVSAKWTRLPDMPRGRCFHAAAAAGGKLYVAGGLAQLGEGQPYHTFAEVDVFDPATQKWSQVAPLPTPRNRLAAVSVKDRVYVLGGMDAANTAIVEIYDPAANTWTTGPKMLSICHGHAAAVIGEKIYVFGGDEQGMKLASELDTAGGTWRKLPDMPNACLFAAAAAVGDSVFVMGNRDRGDLPLLRLDVASETWDVATAKSVRTHRTGACAIEKYVFVVGGEDNDSGGNLSRVSCYDTTSGTWHHSD